MPLITFSGLASGIDSDALIQAISDATRQARIDPLQEKVDAFTAENDKLEELKDLLNDLKDYTDNFRIINGGATSKIADSSDETVLTATALNSAYNTSSTITVNAIASNATLSFNDTFSATTDVINSSAGSNTVDFSIGTGTEQESFSINVDNTTTVDDFVTAFNNAATKAVATAVNVGTSDSPSYKIVITSLNEGTLKGTISVTDNEPLFTSGYTLNQATDADITVSGITGSITRSTNSISDVIPGVTLQLEKTGTATVTINDDIDGTTATVQSFVDKYNAIVEFIAENNIVAPPADDPNGLNEFGPLAKTGIDEGALSSIRSSLSAISYSSGSAIKILADLGITTQRDGTLNFDSDTLESAIASEPESVRQILASVGDSLGTLTSSGGVIDPYTRFNGLIDVTEQANQDQIDSMNQDIADLEQFIARQEDLLRQRFARLESIVNDLQSQQAALTSVMSGIG